jgi:hypothetical protein
MPAIESTLFNFPYFLLTPPNPEENARLSSSILVRGKVTDGRHS